MRCHDDAFHMAVGSGKASLTDVQPLGGPGRLRVHDGDGALERDRGAVHAALPVIVHRQEGTVLAAGLQELPQCRACHRQLSLPTHQLRHCILDSAPDTGQQSSTWSKVFTRRQGMQAHRFLPNSLGTSAWLSRAMALPLRRPCFAGL